MLPSSSIASHSLRATLLHNNSNHHQWHVVVSQGRVAASRQWLLHQQNRPSSTQATDASTTTTDDAAAAAAAASSSPEPMKFSKTFPSTPRMEAVFERISKLTKDEVKLLSRLAIHNMGMTLHEEELRMNEQPAFDANAAAAAAAEAEVEAAPAKTKFDVKLVGYEEASKIKVIKEVRAIAGLGLKEAKEFVESSPKVLQKDLTDEQAQELKQKLEAVGAQIEIL